LDIEIATEKVKGEISRALIERYTAQIDANKGLVRLYEAQMNMAKKLAQSEALHIDAFRSSIQVFTLGVRNITEQAQQGIISAETSAIMAKTEEAQLYAQDLVIKAETLQIEIDGLRLKYASELQSTESHNELIAAYPALLENEAEITGEKIDAQVLNITERERARLAEVHAELAISNAQPVEAEADYYANIDAAGIRGQEHPASAQHQANMENYKYIFYDSVIEEAKAEMAAILKDAKLTNIFTKHIA
jgi:hypothetical protein